MNRDLYHPLTIGAIIIWIIMALAFYIPLMVLLPILALAFTLHLHFRADFTFYLLILTISVIIGTFGLERVNLENSREYLPLQSMGGVTGDICVTKDSIPTRGGFFTTGELIRVHSPQFSSTSLKEITVFSKSELMQGAVLDDCKIKVKDGKFSVTVKAKKEPIEKYQSPYYSFRAEILKKMKSDISSPLLIALITGNRGGLDRDDIDGFRKSGCSHILALSGFHVSIITLLIILLLRLFFTGNKIFVISGVVLAIYLGFVGVTPSLLRSVIMFIIATVFKLKKWKISVFRILVISYYIVIIIVPGEFYTLSFKLSYLALAGILTLGGELERVPIFRILPTIIKAPISASIAAIIATSFITFPLFGTLYPVGIIASIVITPIITIFMWLGILSVFIPKLSSLLSLLENFIYYLLGFFSNSPVINNSSTISNFITLIISLIPVILLVIKLYRRVNARRFNLKFKL